MLRTLTLAMANSRVLSHQQKGVPFMVGVSRIRGLNPKPKNVLESRGAVILGNAGLFRRDLRRNPKSDYFIKHLCHPTALGAQKA